MMSTAFSTIRFYVAVGFDIRDLSCGIYVGTEEPSEIFNPPYGRVHIITHKFEFTSAKKIPFARIITALRTNVMPSGGYNHPTNPDNKHLIGFSSKDITYLVNGLRKIIAGLSEYDSNWNPMFIETSVSVDRLNILVSEESTKSLNLNIPSAVILLPKEIHIHVFESRS